MNLKTRIEKLEIVTISETGETHQERLERESREMYQRLHDAESAIILSMRLDHQLLVLRELNDHYESGKGYLSNQECSLLAYHTHHIAVQSWLGRPANLTMPPALAELWLQRDVDCKSEWHRHEREICVDCLAEHPYQRAREWSAKNPVAVKRYAERCVLCGGELIDTFLHKGNNEH